MKYALWSFVFLFSLGLDQFSKFWAKNNLVFNSSIEVIPQILNFRLLFNTGAAFSSLSEQTTLLALMSAAASMFLLVYSFKKIPNANKILVCALAFLTAGAIGNLIDRAFFRQVTDFIDLLPLPGDFPIFNVADVCINFGVALYIIDLLLQVRRDNVKASKISSK